MSKKGIKNQHSAQALDDDALENVAGGYDYYTSNKSGRKSFEITRLTPEEEAFLWDKYKISFDKNIFLFKTFLDDKTISAEKIKVLLDEGGFTGEEYFWQ